MSGEASQEEVEKEAEEERRAIELHKSQWEELQAKAREEQERERQRMEEAGASWGMRESSQLKCQDGCSCARLVHMKKDDNCL